MTIDVTRTIDAPPDEVWRLLTDTTTWPKWGPSITEVESSSPWIELGTTGRVRTLLGLWVRFEVTELEASESEHTWRWRVAGIRATGHRVTRGADGRTRLTFELPTWAVPYAPVCLLACRRIERLCRGAAATARRVVHRR
jgi:uncharacterized protein YndB with AHSA1/START domain